MNRTHLAAAHRAAPLALLGLALAACNPTFAPPVRSGIYGAPGRLREATFEVGGSGTQRGTGGLFEGFVVAPGLAVEVGGELSALDTDGRWAMGWVGARYSIDQLRDEAGDGFSADVEAGAGAGVGGRLHDDDTAWFDRPAGGGYLGSGVAWHSEWFAAFGRARIQVTGAVDVPATLWWQALLGPEAAIGPVSVYLALGWAGYTNEADANNGGLLDTGVSIHF